jgi:hypothetical protein
MGLLYVNLFHCERLKSEIGYSEKKKLWILLRCERQSPGRWAKQVDFGWPVDGWKILSSQPNSRRGETTSSEER